LHYIEYYTDSAVYAVSVNTALTAPSAPLRYLPAPR
jgi:hypothetical protein